MPFFYSLPDPMMSEKPLKSGLDALFGSLTDALIAVDEKGGIVLFNQAAEDLIRIKAEDTFGRGLHEILRGNDFLYGIMEKVCSTGRSCTVYDQLMHRGDGEPVPVSVSAFHIRGEGGGVGFLVRDTSIVRRLEEGAKHTEQLESFRTLSLGLAHEIRNPLAGIRGAAQLMKNELCGAGQESLGEYAAVVMKEADRLDRLVAEFLEFAGSLRLACAPLNIHSLLDEIIEMQRMVPGAENIRFARRYDPSLPPVMGDRQRLVQVFLNVLKNGMEAMQKGGEISVSTAMPPELIYSSLKVNNVKRRMIAVKIGDQGVGISPEKLKEVFNPFFTTKPKGLGLGLALSLKIIEEHQGAMHIESDEGTGTTVIVYLPIAG